MFETNYTEEMSEKINRYMYLILIDLISKYNRGEYLELEPVNKDIAENGRIPVWVCWWQGLDSVLRILLRDALKVFTDMFRKILLRFILLHLTITWSMQDFHRL